MGIFSKINDLYDTKEMREEVKEAVKRAKEYNEKPEPGIYPVYIKSMEPKLTKNNDPMLAIQFKVSEGTHKGKILFANFMLTQGWLVAKASEFLSSLGSDIEVVYHNLNQYEETIDDIYQWTVDNEVDYDIEYSIRNGKYDEYKVIGVFTK